jgi:alpha-L-rhamnosidase
VIVATDLRCERLLDPIGVGTRAPRLTWRLEATEGESDVLQEAWEVEVGEGNDVTWETGRLDGRDQQVIYAGPPLESRTTCWWRVRAWTTAGATDWSQRTSFEIGLLDSGNWSARMITAQASTPVIRFSKVFDVDEVSSARLYLTAHGAVAASINGDRVGDEVLAPGWTSYNRRLAYRTLDVIDLLRPGRNEIEALVAPAWFSGRFGLRGTRGYWGAHVGVLAQLELDGRSVATTDESWIASTTPYLLAEIYDGETYDGRLKDASPETVPVRAIEFDPSILVAPAVPPVRRTGTLTAVSKTAVGGALQIDFGQNLVGRLRVTVRRADPGTQIVMRHAELLGPDGRLYTEPLRSAKATDTYIARGDAEETYEPTFTFHGFRWAEISGVDPECLDVEAVVVHSDIERTGFFECSDPLINQLHSNVVWGQRGNFVSVPTDCPQRDERLGWTGDAQVFSSTASFLHDCETFWENWLADLAADQREDGCVPPVIPDMEFGIGYGACGWGDAAVVVPWTTYEAYGDSTVLRRAMPSMVAWADYVFTRLDDDHRWVKDFQFGDWLDPDAPESQPWKAKARYDLVATAYAVRSSDLVARTADVLGDGETARRYEERAALIRESWWRNYAEAAATTQTGCALAICFDLAPSDTDRQSMGDALVKLIRDAGNHLGTGFLGTPLLLPALAATGHADVAYDVLLQTSSPSWLYQVKAGATTIWERWDALHPDGSVAMESLGGGSGGSMVSFNHYAYGAVADWMHRTLAGLAPGEPGYRHVLIEPQPGGGLTHASASLESPYGRIAVGWRVENGTFALDVSIPPNSTATVKLADGTTEQIGSGERAFSTAV